MGCCRISGRARRRPDTAPGSWSSRPRHRPRPGAFDDVPRGTQWWPSAARQARVIAFSGPPRLPPTAVLVLGSTELRGQLAEDVVRECSSRRDLPVLGEAGGLEAARAKNFSTSASRGTPYCSAIGSRFREVAVPCRPRDRRPSLPSPGRSRRACRPAYIPPHP